jgi:hypothetical protein
LAAERPLAQLWLVQLAAKRRQWLAAEQRRLVLRRQ